MTDFFSYSNGKQYTRDEFKVLVEGLLSQARKDSRITNVLNMVDGKNLLDVGCYIGIISRILAEKDKEVLAVDILKDEIKKAKLFNQVSGVNYQCANILEMTLPDNQFDTVLFLEAIEHVNNPEDFLKEFLRILKPGGSLIISTPNALSYMNILYNIFLFSKKRRLHLINSLITEPKNTGTELDHIYSWDFRTLLRYLVRSGFEYADHKFSGAYPFSIRIAGRRFNILGRKELKFLLPILGPYLTTIVVKVKKPCAMKKP